MLHTCVVMKYCVCTYVHVVCDMLYTCAVMKCCMYQCPLAVPPSSVSISGRGSSSIEYTQILSLTCSGSGIVDNYQWFRNSTRLTTTSSSYYRSSAQLSDSGVYYCEACNWAGCTNSSSHTVTVTGRLMAVSTEELYIETVTVCANF